MFGFASDIRWGACPGIRTNPHNPDQIRSNPNLPPNRPQYIVRYLFAFLTLLMIIACGGGGGGGAPATTALVVDTDWRLRDQPGGGRSYRLTITTEHGALIRSVIVESPSDTVVSTRLDGLTAGAHRLRSELYSGPTLTGVRTGILEMPIHLGSTQTLTLAVGAPSASIKVLPDTAQVAVPRSIRLFAHARTAAGVPTFSPDAAFTWTVLGGIGTVNAEGVFQAGTAGQGAVRATHQPTGQIGASSITTTPPQTSNSKWTVLVYMSAASDLYPFSDLNMNQMERVAQNPDVRFVVQWKQSTATYPNSSFDGTRRYLVRPDQGSSIASELIQDLGGQVDMGKWESLREFVNWGKTHFPSERTVLIIWGHGNGWRRTPNQPLSRAVAYDDQTRSAIQIWDLKKALAGLPVDILAWDASLMQMFEVAYEVRGVTSFVVGSEESPPAEGYPYDTVLARFRDQPDASTRDLTKAFVDGMLSVPGYASRKITQSSLDTSKLDALERAIDSLAVELMANGSALRDAIVEVRASAQSYSPNSSPPRYYRDLFDVCLKLEAQTDIPSVKLACAQVRAAVSAAVAWEGHNANSPGSHGVSIDFTPGVLFLNSANDYQQLEFGVRNRWDDWLVTSP